MLGKPVSGDRHTQRVLLDTPIVRKPHWQMPAWLWVLKQVVMGVLALVGWLLERYLRFWWVTVPATLVGLAFWRYGWELATPGMLLVAGLLLAWWWKHPATFWRWLGWFYLAQIRRWFVYRKPWYPTQGKGKVSGSFCLVAFGTVSRAGDDAAFPMWMM